MVSTSLFFEDRGKHLYAQISGPYPEEEIEDVLWKMRKEAEALGLPSLLIDAMRLDTPRHDLFRFVVGRHIAEIFGQKFRVAIVFPKHLINKLAENTAVNRGALLQVCGSEEEALQWLLS
ncbi:MAG: hypothetical protein H6727_17065 [Myxococcales bacterium]|nr:hypothetical protein [Myxococcales bacterium]